MKEEFEYEIAMKSEKRKLKQEDAEKIRQRQKNQINIKKLEILIKENEHDAAIQAKRYQDEVIKEKKRQMNVQTKIEKEKMKQTASMLLSKSVPLLRGDEDQRDFFITKMQEGGHQGGQGTVVYSI